MKKTLQMSGKPIPPLFYKRAVNDIDKGPKETTPQEMEPPPQEKSPPKKKTFKASTFDSTDVLKAATAGATKEVSGLFAKFAEALCEMAAADTSRMQELEGILTEARNLEAHLIEKKKHMRQMLALISDKLQG